MQEGLLVGGKYRLLKLIGSGGMGAVWVACNELTEREFAIKFLHPSAVGNPKVLARFFQEAKVSGRLRHPSILEIFDVGTATELDGAPFLVMELLEGVPLDLAIRYLDGLPLRLTLQIVITMARALTLAHDRGVIHRDLKPANVFLHRSPSGGIQPKLLDFGISKLSRETNTSDSGIGLTQTGAVLGSPLYMSPEQAAGDKHVDGRSDIHALGVLTWWCLLARSPFKSTTYNTLVVEIITGERPRLCDAMPEVPQAISDIVTKAFSRRREDRFATATEFADALEAEFEKLGAGPPLESRKAADEFFARVNTVHPGSIASQRAADAQASTTTGAVSVSVDDAIPQDSHRSPAAYTMDSARSIALAPTQASKRITLSATPSTASGLVTTGQVPRSNTSLIVAIAAATMLLLGGIGAGVALLRANTTGATSSSGGAATQPAPPSTASTTPPVVTVPSAVALPPIPVPSARPSESAAAPLPSVKATVPSATAGPIVRPPNTRPLGPQPPIPNTGTRPRKPPQGDPNELGGD